MTTTSEAGLHFFCFCSPLRPRSPEFNPWRKEPAEPAAEAADAPQQPLAALALGGEPDGASAALHADASLAPPAAAAEPESPVTPPAVVSAAGGVLPLLTPPMSAPLLKPVPVVEVRDMFDMLMLSASCA